MEANEQYVRSKWKDCEASKFCNKVVVRGCWDGFAPNKLFGTNGTDWELSGWQAAYDFTIQREEEIRQVEEEIAWLIRKEHMQNLADREPWKRVLVARQAVLADLTKGFKP